MTYAVLIFFLVFCVVQLCSDFLVVMSVTFLHNTIFGSSLPQVVCRSAHVLFTLLVFVCV